MCTNRGKWVRDLAYELRGANSLGTSLSQAEAEKRIEEVLGSFEGLLTIEGLGVKAVVWISNYFAKQVTI